jgi:hypothetical protein
MTNSDARPPRDALRHDAAILDRQAARCEIEAVVLERDAQRLRQVARAAAEIALDIGTSAASSACHQSDAVDRLQRANQHRRRRAFTLCDRVDQIVDPVVQIHVGEPRPPIKRLVAHRRAGRCVTGGIVFADVGLGLDDHSRRGTATRSMNQNLPE